MSTILDHPILSRRYFFPGREAPATPSWVDVDGARLACAHLVHDPSWPTLLHFHGNGEVVCDYVPEWAKILRELRWNGFFVEYRGYGASTGLPALVAMLDDALRAFDALHLPPHRVVVFGRSVGSIYAIHVAAQRPGLAGLVLESGIDDPLERVLLRVTPEELGVDHATLAREAAEHLDHRKKLAGFEGRVLILHAFADHLVDRGHADRLAGWCAGTVRKVIFPKGDHNTIFWANRDHYLVELGHFLSAAASTGRETAGG